MWFHAIDTGLDWVPMKCDTIITSIKSIKPMSGLTGSWGQRGCDCN